MVGPPAEHGRMPGDVSFLFFRMRIWIDVEISMDLPERTRTLHELLNVKKEKVHFELSVTRRGDKEGQSKLEVSSGRDFGVSVVKKG